LLKKLVNSALPNPGKFGAQGKPFFWGFFLPQSNLPSLWGNPNFNALWGERGTQNKPKEGPKKLIPEIIRGNYRKGPRNPRWVPPIKGRKLI